MPVLWHETAVASDGGGDGLREVVASGTLFDVVNDLRTLPRWQVRPLRLAFPDRAHHPFFITGQDIIDMIPAWHFENARRRAGRE